MTVSLPVVSTLFDGFSRRINYLRVSLTDRCNYRCTYCMPADGVVFRRRAELLSFEEIERVVRVFVGLGVERVRLTGGEPTVRADVVGLVARLAAIPGPHGRPLRLAMTSNAHRFADLAEPLSRAGLGSVNISIDTLDPQKFRQLTVRGEIDAVLRGIDAAVRAGLKVKLNAVAMNGVNDEEVVDLCRYAWDRGIVMRFIEHMPMSGGQTYSASRQLSAAQICERIAGELGTTLSAVDPTERANGAAGPARYWRLDDGSDRQFGIISAMSEHFCESCNRLRISATGDLHACLGYDDATSLRDIMRGIHHSSGKREGTDDELRAAIFRSVGVKRVGHEFQVTGGGAPSKHMVSIGG